MFDIKGDADLLLNSEGDLILEQTPGSLFKKAILTPKGYMAIEYDIDTYIDEAYGNAIYFKIKENINNSIIVNINDDVKDAASFVNIPISNIQSSINSLSRVDYTITYKDQTTEEISINV